MEKIKRILKIDLPPSQSAFLWVARKTVKEYYQILVDTLPGKFVEPYKKRQERQVISKAAKFYLFDVGVAGALSKRHIQEERGEFFGKALEHQSGYDRFTGCDTSDPPGQNLFNYSCSADSESPAGFLNILLHRCRCYRDF